MAAWGNPEAAAQLRAQAAEAARDEGLAIHPDNHATVRWFLALQSQWRTVGLSTLGGAAIRRTGLDYGAAEATARLARIETDADDFARLRVMESEALKAWREQAESEAKR